MARHLRIKLCSRIHKFSNKNPDILYNSRKAFLNNDIHYSDLIYIVKAKIFQRQESCQIKLNEFSNQKTKSKKS